jgi:hypothetical protein
MLFLVIERFRNRDPKPVYRRLRESGRNMPAGLRFIDSWVEPSFARCFQLMEAEDARLLQRWVAAWTDLMEFEILPVVSSKDTCEEVEAVLDAGDKRAQLVSVAKLPFGGGATPPSRV